MNKTKITKKLRTSLFLIVCVVYTLGIIFFETYAVPTGATVTNLSTMEGAAIAGSRSDEGGTVTILTLNTTQQNFGWKAYVGNISGTLTLDDANGWTIYDWSLNVSAVTGEVYAARTDSITWSSVNCSGRNATEIIATEETALNFGSTDIDAINKTFSENIHDSFIVAGRSITVNSCPSIATYVNDTAQTYNTTSRPLFQELLLDDGTNMIYTTIFEQDKTGYDNSSTFDFQLLVADDETSGVQTTYYFFAELDAV
ncbi:MAG: hypothetical protein ABIC91_02595 [Nanoarchaeota archaeon]